jgi:hypothetical protein
LGWVEVIFVSVLACRISQPGTHVRFEYWKIEYIAKFEKMVGVRLGVAYWGSTELERLFEIRLSARLSYVSKLCHVWVCPVFVRLNTAYGRMKCGLGPLRVR